MDANKLLPLSFLSEGEKGTVVKLNGGRSFQEKMLSVGINQGNNVEILSGTPGQALPVKIGDTRLALGFGLAQKIEIEKQLKEVADGR